MLSRYRVSVKASSPVVLYIVEHVSDARHGVVRAQHGQRPREESKSVVPE